METTQPVIRLEKLTTSGLWRRASVSACVAVRTTGRRSCPAGSNSAWPLRGTW
jgi:hypothetical protein